MQPDFLAVGHIVKDIADGGWRAGGGVLYAAAQARALGLATAVVTRCASDLDPKSVLPGVEWHVRPSDVTTSFHNTYVDGRRDQALPALSEPLDADDIPLEWRRGAVIVLLAPVFHDVDDACGRAFTSPKRFLGLGAQGWLRRLEGEKVMPGSVEARPSWLHGDAVFVSEEDLVEPEAAHIWLKRVPRVVLTRGARGSTVWDAAGRLDIPAFATPELDATGAGDIFATAFMIRLHETGDSGEAALFASAAAALAVNGVGIGAVGNRGQIDAVLSRERVRA
jgi:hypothetical protein